jgi:hypothetical protein
MNSLRRFPFLAVLVSSGCYSAPPKHDPTDSGSTTDAPTTTQGVTTSVDTTAETSAGDPSTDDPSTDDPSTGDPSTGDPSTGDSSDTDASSSGSTGTVDVCDPSPCINGTCEAEGSDAVCACDLGWDGAICDACAKGYVDVGGECVAATCDGVSCGDGTCEVVDDVPSCSQVFAFTGAEQTWDVPVGVTSIRATALGAAGGCALGGLGGESIAELVTTPGETLYLYVGGVGACSMQASLPGGFNGGGDKFTDQGDSWEGGSGGGGTDVRRGGNTLADRVLVAGGGGGTGWGGEAGDGGGIVGQDGNPEGGGCNDTCAGAGGTQVGGGAGGFCFDQCVGAAGSLGVGGDSVGCAAAGGGGGGGYYGGGGGGHCSGGGGSSRADFPGNSDASTNAGIHAGDGELTIMWLP